MRYSMQPLNIIEGSWTEIMRYVIHASILTRIVFVFEEIDNLKTVPDIYHSNKYS